jgi:xanthine dehydrogenase molybdopterin-binding subunit B
MDQLTRSSRYLERRAAVAAYNATHEFVKRGIAMTPVKFGISFTTSFLNQAGALVLIYKDGTILVNHGGTEMGQGLHTKIRQIAAAEFGVALETVKVNATSTAKVPNTSATAASAGTDLNGMAVKDAVDTLKARIAAAMAPVLSGEEAATVDPTRPEDVVFSGGRIADARHPERSRSFAESMPLMHLRQVSLAATGFYRTPTVGWDSAKGFGKPFYYFAYGMAVTEAEVDLLTGRHTILRADILHDVGDSINPAIDIGQVEGGYVQGLGWCTTEEIKWDARGNLLTHSPDTYKIPAVRDIPREFHTALLSGVPNPGTIRASKAVAEPPFMLALSAWLAIKDAVSAAAGHTREPELSLPATYEVVLLSLERLTKA